MAEAKNWIEFFENFSYKPNWEFDLDARRLFECNEAHLTITMRVPDSRRPIPKETVLDHIRGTKVVIPLVPVTKVAILGNWYGEEEAKRLVRWHIQEVEMHEVDEWFKYKGELSFDPH